MYKIYFRSYSRSAMITVMIWWFNSTQQSVFDRILTTTRILAEVQNYFFSHSLFHTEKKCTQKPHQFDWDDDEKEKQKCGMNQITAKKIKRISSFFYTSIPLSALGLMIMISSAFFYHFFLYYKFFFSSFQFLCD